MSDDHAVLLPTRTNVQQNMLAAVVQQHVPVNGSGTGDTVLPAPVRDIYQRLADKQHQVTSMSADSNDDVSHLLSSVHRGESVQLVALPQC